MKMNEKSYLTIEEISSLPTVSSVNINEDGEKVAFVKKTANWNDNTYQHQVWIYEKEKGQSERLTTNEIDSTAPLWSPNSKDIAYLSPVGDGDYKNNQIFVKSIDGNNEVQITSEIEGVSQFKWSPSRKGLYYLAKSKKSEVMKNRKQLYGDFDHVGKEYQNHCFYYIAQQEPSIVEQLTDGKAFHIHEFDLSGDGKKAVLLATPTSDSGDDMNKDLYLLDLETGELQKQNIDKFLGGRVCFSPEGNKICYAASIKEKEYYQTDIQDYTLEIYDLNSGESLHPLTDVDSSVSPIRWTVKGILMRWQSKTNYLIGLLAEDGTVEIGSENVDGFILDASITSDGNHLSYTKAITNETFEIYLDDKKITNENRFFDGKLVSKREIISWKSSDGLEIEGVLSTPVAFDADEKYPLLVVSHGGPAWASFPIFSDCFNEKYPIEPFIEKGFIVLEPNYRGSSGYGNAFLKANYRKLGIAYYDDLISGVDYLIGKGIVDEDRVGVMGWSNGGYLSAFCSTYSNRFKAVSVGGGITNWVTNYVNTDIPSLIRTYLGDNPWNDPEIYLKTSPMTYIKSACTPTLIQHGEKDARVPIVNAFELHQGLRDMEVETEFIVFKGMAYSPDQPGMKMAIMKQNLIWFSHYHLGESMKDFRPLSSPSCK